MLDNRIRPYLDPLLNRLGQIFVSVGLTANGLTWGGFCLGVASAFAIVQHHFLIGLVLLLLSRLCDGLDGTIARLTAKTDLGGFLDIVLDFAFYGMIPLAFILADPEANGLAGAVLLFAFYVNGASFLTFALISEKRGIDETKRGSKTFLYSVGLAEATETLIAFCLFCLFPGFFGPIAFTFAAITAFTTMARIALAYQTFVD